MKEIDQRAPGEPGQEARNQQDAIDELFAMFKIAFPAQFERHYSDVRMLNVTKKLWYSYLKHIPVRCIQEAARAIVSENRFLPTVAEFLDRCTEAGQFPPDPAPPSISSDKTRSLSDEAHLKHLRKMRETLGI